MDKIVISPMEVAETVAPAEQPTRPEPKLAPAVPWWAKTSMAVLVLVLPLLCLVAIVLRVAMRNLPPRTRHEWTAFVNILLVISGLLTSATTVAVMSFAPLPAVVASGLSELDERSDFPHLPATDPLSAKNASQSLKTLVAVITPARRSWLSHQELPGASIGAGTLLQANDRGYLFLTARHVVDGPAFNVTKESTQALIAMASGTWATAEVVARHKYLDLLLLWMPREFGHGVFTQPLAPQQLISEGQTIFVIGHPEGLRFTLSTGIISRIEGDTLQMSAPVSPGNSGGPVFDEKGNLLGIVTSMVDKHGDPNAENLNFSIRAGALRQESDWDFDKVGRSRLADYLAGDTALQPAIQATSH